MEVTDKNYQLDTIVLFSKLFPTISKWIRENLDYIARRESIPLGDCFAYVVQVYPEEHEALRSLAENKGAIELVVDFMNKELNFANDEAREQKKAKKDEDEQKTTETAIVEKSAFVYGSYMNPLSALDEDTFSEFVLENYCNSLQILLFYSYNLATRALFDCCFFGFKKSDKFCKRCLKNYFKDTLTFCNRNFPNVPGAAICYFYYRILADVQQVFPDSIKDDPKIKKAAIVAFTMTIKALNESNPEEITNLFKNDSYQKAGIVLCKFFGGEDVAHCTYASTGHRFFEIDDAV